MTDPYNNIDSECWSQVVYIYINDISLPLEGLLFASKDYTPRQDQLCISDVEKDINNEDTKKSMHDGVIGWKRNLKCL